MNNRPAPKKKIKFDEQLDSTMLRKYLEVGNNWKEIERTMRSEHLEAVVDRTADDIIESLRHHWTWLQKNKDTYIKDTRPYNRKSCKTSKEEWDAREAHRIAVQ
jgi:hypothetical protein